MTSLIQQNIRLLDRMSSLELQCIEELVRSRINSRKSTAGSLPPATGLLSIPLEIRDEIYYLVGLDHLLQLRKVNSTRKRFVQGPLHPLFLVNKQVNHEFMSFFYGRHMIRAVYFDDDTTEPICWFRVPPWLLEELFRSQNVDECHLDWIQPLANKVGKVVRKEIADECAKDRRKDPDLPYTVPGDLEEQFKYRHQVDLAKASRFHGYLEIAGNEEDSSTPILATLHFEKYLLSEDLWFKVKGYTKKNTVWARNSRYRKESVTIGQRSAAVARAQKEHQHVPERAKTCHFPKQVGDGKGQEECRILTSSETRQFLEKAKSRGSRVGMSC